MAFKAIYPAKRSSDKDSKSNNGRGRRSGRGRNGSRGRRSGRGRRSRSN